jgi:hypothetical protein
MHSGHSDPRGALGVVQKMEADFSIQESENPTLQTPEHKFRVFSGTRLTFVTGQQNSLKKMTYGLV